MFSTNGRTGYTGHLFEEEVARECVGVNWNGDYVPFRQSEQIARNHQPGDPSDPQGTIKVLFDLVAQALGSSSLKFFTAVGSPLDQWHRRDGWFEFGGRKVPIDVTMNGGKHGTRDTLIIRPETLEDPGLLNQAASDIAFALK